MSLKEIFKQVFSSKLFRDPMADLQHFPHHAAQRSYGVEEQIDDFHKFLDLAYRSPHYIKELSYYLKINIVVTIYTSLLFCCGFLI